jgi:hypothetical protein
MNWKEQLADEFNWEKIFGENNTALKKTQDFISTQIIEKIIDDIPDTVEYGDDYKADNTAFKQQLRDKYLNN